jgi:glycosyltransferase involved in cell wall biosynthesis
MTVDRLLLSVVIPTFDRASELTATISSLCASRLRSPGSVELIVVDDGSARPAEDHVLAVEVPSRFTLRVVRQENQGVGSARNRGFTEARGPVVLFVDDDMIVLPDMLQGHLDAHRSRPGSVVFGRSPYVRQRSPTPFTTWVLDLPTDPHARGHRQLVPVEVVASGHLSVERTTVAGWRQFYDDTMRTPVAEEFELSHRLSSHGIPMVLARDVIALHRRQISLDTFLRQQYGHGKGCGEVTRLVPAVLALDELRTVIDHHTRTGFRSLPWPILRTSLGRRMLLGLARAADRRQVPRRIRSLAFTAASGAAFSAGVRDGLRGS